MNTWQIDISGRVQGVGFRPFIYRLARQFSLLGTVHNDESGVRIVCNADEEILHRFLAEIRQQKPSLSDIRSIEFHEIQPVDFYEFSIIQTQKHNAPSVDIAPDAHLCADCLREMNDPSDRRYRYALINCMHCGPRYSIINRLPYDRASTSMAHFPLCDACRAEYEDPLSRRYHAQPIACPDCGPHLIWRDATDSLLEHEEALQAALSALSEGKIIAIKSTGGFHLVVDAHNDEAVKMLRARKNRPDKPFALMAKDVQAASKYAHVSPDAQQWLEHTGRPIVLMPSLNRLPDSIAPRVNQIGIMLPSSGLHNLLFENMRDIVVMTSGNLSGLPMEFTDEGALRLLSIADGILMHNRPIVARVDDSVIRVMDNWHCWIRKSRGFAPYAVDLSVQNGWVACGSHLKNTLALSHRNHIWVSGHIGDLSYNFAERDTIEQHLADLYSIKINQRIVDAHPDLQSAFEGAKTVQHHHAHFVSCRVDNHLQGVSLGFIFDGLGYGEQGALWGAECLLGHARRIERIGHLRTIDLIGGDKATHEIKRIGQALLWQCGVQKASGRLFELWQKRVNVFETSSMGRFLDGLSAILGLCENVSFEGQGPLLLESLLDNDLSLLDGYRLPVVWQDKKFVWDFVDLIQSVVRDLADRVPHSVMSRKIHTALVQSIVSAALECRAYYDFNHIVLSGGVFQNAFLAINAQNALKNAGFSAFIHQNIPPGDAGICVGQMGCFATDLE